MAFQNSKDLKMMIDTLPQIGKVEWIGIRPARKTPLQPLEEAVVTAAIGLQGDHYSKADGNRQVTLLQAEHLVAIASYLKMERIDPRSVRRNIVVSGVNLLAFNDRPFQIGEVILHMTGSCHPCTRMEIELGPGGYNAMRGHGGITAKVVKGGTIRLGDAVKLYVVME